MRSLAADDLVDHYRDFGGGIEFEADPRRRTEALCEQVHSGKERTDGELHIRHVFPYGRTELRILPSVVFVCIGGMRPILSEESPAVVDPFDPSLSS